MIVELLRETRKIVGSGWTQRAWAKDKNGKFVSEGDPTAVCWCLSGALSLAKERLGASEEVFVGAYNLLSRRSGCRVVMFNDAPERTKEEVLDQVIVRLV